MKLSDERIEMLLRVGSREAKAVFPDAGDYSFRLSVRDSVCGVVESEEKHIRIVGEVPVPGYRQEQSDVGHARHAGFRHHREYI